MNEKFANSMADLDTAKSEYRKDDKQISAQSQTLVDKFHANERGARATGILPVRVDFPAYGPSLFLVSELTSENQSPSAEFNYQQKKKAGGK
jgi:hypothetical protein